MPSANRSLDPFAGRNLRWLLERRAEASGDREALVWRDFAGGNERWTYRTLLDAVDRVAGGLAGRGIGSGDRVALCLGNCPEFIFAWFALASLGAVTVAINNRSTEAEIAAFLRRVDARLVIADLPLRERVEAAAASLHIATLVVERGEGSGGGAPADRSFSRLRAADPPASWPRVPCEAAAMIQFTSGTSSEPKGVIWTQGNLLWAGKVSAAHEHLVADDRHLVMLPLFHANAQSYSVLAALWVGAAVILLPRFSTSRFWPLSMEERATWCSITGFGIKALLGQPVPAGHTYRCFGSGAVNGAWRRHVGVPNMAWWGMTETVTHGIVSDPVLPCPDGTMGYPAPEYELRIVGDGDGEPIAGFGDGLLEVSGVRGRSMALGYLDDAEATAAAWRADGWFRTGDRVRRNLDGTLSFVDREKDVIRVGGENVAAQEVERVIARVPAVGEVAVVALPHDMLQEVPAAFVVAGYATDTLLADIRRACDEALADFKRPRAVFVVDALPKGLLDKVLKKDLRRRAIELTAQQDGATPGSTVPAWSET